MQVRHDKCSVGVRLGLGLTLAVALGLLVFAGSAVRADGVRGGQLYDQWWLVTGAAAPVGEHPLYPEIGEQSASSTFRCKECHGWDYQGVDGAYGSGSRFTGIPGVFESALSAADMFQLIKSPDGDGTGGTMVNGHGYGSYGLSDTDILDLVDMLQGELIDTDDFIDADGVFFGGDEVQGEALWGGAGTCIMCHGADGTAINFGTPEAPHYVGSVAAHNPWEFMHKVRFAPAVGVMPSWLLGPGDNQSVVDIGRFAATFPTGECEWTLGDSNGDALTDLADAVHVLNFLFQSGTPPVPQLEAADVNGDAIVDLADVVYLLEYQFQSGPPLLPTPTC